MIKPFNERLEELRKAAGLSQQELATACELSTSTIQKMERGGVDPSWSTVQKLAAALELGFEDLADLSPQKKEEIADLARGFIERAKAKKKS